MFLFRPEVVRKLLKVLERIREERPEAPDMKDRSDVYHLTNLILKDDHTQLMHEIKPATESEVKMMTTTMHSFLQFNMRLRNTEI